MERPAALESVVAVALAAGSGSRVGGQVPKQFVDLAGRPVLAYSVGTFAAIAEIDRLVIVASEPMLSTATAIGERAAGDKLVDVVVGGAERSDSSRAALDALADDPPSHVLIHDAARPLVEASVVEGVIAALGMAEAAAPAVAVSDTVAHHREGIIEDMPPRTSLRALQTPQGFAYATIAAAYELAEADPDFAATDDCGVVHRYLPDTEIHLVPGSERNLKITHYKDLEEAKRILLLSRRT